MHCRAGTAQTPARDTVPALRSGMAAMQVHRLRSRTAPGPNSIRVTA
jgi:hypothetical protein